MKVFLIISLLLLTATVGRTQLGAPVKQFYKEIDARGYDGDYNAHVVSLYPDSIIEIKHYHKPPAMYGQSFCKTTYIGKYSAKNDSFFISSISGYTQVKSDDGKKIASYSVSMNTITKGKNCVFFLRNGKISTPDFLFPELPETIPAADLLIKGLEESFQKKHGLSPRFPPE
jgi:hypothetical protein